MTFFFFFLIQFTALKTIVPVILSALLQLMEMFFFCFWYYSKCFLFVAAILNDKRLQDKKKFSRPVPGKLYFTNVAKTDYMVIQCNASNIHGYVFSDVYLNILGEVLLLFSEAYRL